MARPRKKKRTQPAAVASTGKSRDDPKSLVIRLGAGDSGRSMGQLVKDVRRMMEPGTASRLKERRSNRLRDYVAMAGPLGVSHLVLFSRSEAGNTSLRLALMPRGPTLTFQVDRYALAKDVQRPQRSVVASPKHFLTPPLLVMNNFSAPRSPEDSTQTDRVLTLATSVFQSLFPPIVPQNTSLASVGRVLLLNRDVSATETGEDPFVLHVRHYAVRTKRTGVSRGIRRLETATKQSAKGMPNLSRLEDAADYVLNPAGFTSGSESEVETDAEVETTVDSSRKVLNRQQLLARRKSSQQVAAAGPTTEKRAIKLTELGPRMKLRLTKIEEGVCAGKVMYHRYLTKSDAENQALDRLWTNRRAQKEERRKIQRENIQRKKPAPAIPAEDKDNAWESDDSDLYADAHDDEDRPMAPMG